MADAESRKPIRLIIAGGRGYHMRLQDIEHLNQIREDYQITLVITGGASGADTEGHNWAIRCGFPTRVFPADWDTHGRAAGPIRNQEMVESADAIVLFPGGRGTADMRRRAQSAGLLFL